MTGTPAFGASETLAYVPDFHRSPICTPASWYSECSVWMWSDRSASVMLSRCLYDIDERRFCGGASKITGNLIFLRDGDES